MTTLPDSPVRNPVTRKHTYGRKVLQSDQQHESSLLFAEHGRLASGADTTTPHPGDAAVDWRQRIAELDSASEEYTTEEGLALAAHQLRRADPHPQSLAATSSLTSLSTASASGPAKAHEHGKTAPEEVADHDADDDGRALELPEHSDSCLPNEERASRSPALDLFDEDDTLELTVQRGGPRALSKADKQQMHRDIAQAERERPVQLSRPEQRYRPVTAWLQNASVAVEPTSSPNPPQVSDDIQQFTPSSAAKNDVQHASSGPIVPASSSPSKSSPTLQSKRAPRSFPKFGLLADDDGEDEEELTLDGVLTAAAKRKSLDARKKAALEKLRESSRRAAVKEEDSLDVVLPPPQPSVTAVERQAPDALAIFNRTAAVAAPSKRQQHFSKMAGKHRPRKPLTETHAEYAAQKFGHADLKRSNAGSRPAGQKAGRDEPVQQTQVNDNLLRHHQKQASEISKLKEAKYGGARQLPPKESLAAARLLPASDTQSVDDNDSDDDYVDQHSVVSTGIRDDDLDSADEDGNTTIVGEIASHLNSQDAEKEGELDDDDGDDVATPRLRKRKSRAPRRFEFQSDDEEDGKSHAQGTAGSELPTINPPQASLDLAGFESAVGGFSQLFGETQPQNTSLQDDAFAALRNQEPGLLPAEALLPSVDISESQALRDKALIAGEAEEGAQIGQGQEGSSEQLYLNSEGFFTQTRPADRSSPTSRSPLTMDHPVDGNASVLPSSTVLNSSSNLENSPTQASFSRLRRRASAATMRSGDGTTATKAKAHDINAFDLLNAGARAETRKEKSNYVDEQAEESDEDGGWVFPQRDDGDVDEEDSGDDGYIKELVDDATLTTEEESRRAMQTVEKHREIAREDDARLEAEAKKMTEGYYRRKRHGNEFMSDEEEDDGRTRNFNKKQRRQRKLDREDGLYKIGGEENKFLEAYEAGLESDVDFEETPASPTGPTSPMNQRLTTHERNEMLRDRGRANRAAGAVPFQDDEDEAASRTFAIRRRKPVPTSADDTENREEVRLFNGKRSVQDLRKFLADEGSNPRRAGGGVSVVQRSNSTKVTNAGTTSHLGSKVGSSRDSKREGRRLGPSNSVLMGRAKRFA